MPVNSFWNFLLHSPVSRPELSNHTQEKEHLKPELPSLTSTRYSCKGQGVLRIPAPLACLSPVKPSRAYIRVSEGTDGGHSAGLSDSPDPCRLAPWSESPRMTCAVFSQRPWPRGQVGTEVQPTIPSPARHPGARPQSPRGRGSSSNWRCRQALPTGVLILLGFIIAHPRGEWTGQDPLGVCQQPPLGSGDALGPGHSFRAA